MPPLAPVGKPRIPSLKTPKPPKKPALPKVKESQIVKEVLEGIHILYKDKLCVWRNQSGMVATKTGHFMHFGATGSADILGILRPSGRFIALECKTATGKQSPGQVQWGSKVIEMGGAYAVVRSFPEAKAFIEEVIAEGI